MYNAFYTTHKAKLFIKKCEESKLRSLRKEDQSRIKFYMKLVDGQIKEVHHNKTIGIIITKESNKLIVNFVREDGIIPLGYVIKEKQ